MDVGRMVRKIRGSTGKDAALASGAYGVNP